MDYYFLDFLEDYPKNEFVTIDYGEDSMNYSYSIERKQKGNDVALEEPLKFRVQATLAFAQQVGDFALVIAPSTVDVTITDFDSKQN